MSKQRPYELKEDYIKSPEDLSGMYNTPADAEMKEDYLNSPEELSDKYGTSTDAEMKKNYLNSPEDLSRALSDFDNDELLNTLNDESTDYLKTEHTSKNSLELSDDELLSADFDLGGQNPDYLDAAKSSNEFRYPNDKYPEGHQNLESGDLAQSTRKAMPLVNPPKPANEPHSNQNNTAQKGADVKIGSATTQKLTESKAKKELNQALSGVDNLMKRYGHRIDDLKGRLKNELRIGTPKEKLHPKTKLLIRYEKEVEKLKEQKADLSEMLEKLDQLEKLQSTASLGISTGGTAQNLNSHAATSLQNKPNTITATIDKLFSVLKKPFNTLKTLLKGKGGKNSRVFPLPKNSPSIVAGGLAAMSSDLAGLTYPVNQSKGLGLRGSKNKSLHEQLKANKRAAKRAKFLSS